MLQWFTGINYYLSCTPEIRLSYRKMFTIYNTKVNWTSYSMHQRKTEMRRCLVYPDLNCASPNFSERRLGTWFKEVINCCAWTLPKQEEIFWGNTFPHKYLLLKARTIIFNRILKKNWFPKKKQNPENILKQLNCCISFFFWMKLLAS